MENFFFYFFFSSLHLFIRFKEIGPSEFVGPKTKSALRDEVPKTRDFAENSGKSSKNPNFLFFSDLRHSNG